MKAIITRYHGADVTKPSTVSATTGHPKNRVTVKVSQFDSADKAHDGAAIALCRKFGWAGPLMKGGLENGDQVYTFENDVNRVLVQL